MSFIDELDAIIERAKGLETENAALRTRVTEQDEIIDLLNGLLAKVQAYAEKQTPLRGVSHPRPVTQDEVQAWAELWRQGKSFSEIGHLYGRKDTSVKRHLARAGVLTSEQPAQPEPQEQPAPLPEMLAPVRIATIKIKTPDDVPQRRTVTPDEVREWIDELFGGLTVYAIAAKYDRAHNVVKRHLVANGVICKDCNQPIAHELQGVCHACKAEKATRMENPAFLQSVHAE